MCALIQNVLCALRISVYCSKSKRLIHVLQDSAKDGEERLGDDNDSQGVIARPQVPLCGR